MSEPRALRVLSWNVGFCGLGAGADFWIDGGRLGLPSTRAEVEANADAIVAEIARQDADVVLLQEANRGGVLSRGVDFVARLERALPGHQVAFHADVDGWRPLARGIGHLGLALAWRGEGGAVRVVDAGIPPTRILPGLRKTHALQVLDLDRDGMQWTISNLHLNAYSPSADRKHGGVARVLSRLQGATGAGVIVGGDWNLLLADPISPGTVPARRLAWAVRFPADALPPGWRLADTGRIPTNRTNETAFDAATNYLSVIDGFVLSPGVKALSARVLDLGFAHSDHNPVLLEARHG